MVGGCVAVGCVGTCGDCGNCGLGSVDWLGEAWV